MKLLLGLLLCAFLGWVVVSLLIARLRRMRGDPVPEPRGPRTITIVCIALVAIYALLVLWRVYNDGFSAFS
ncbi:hypothetical protein T5B8_04256 [Salinisphaera sp. T5B8]|uniref:hypothetical protein n=1 Tax=unclassified Salinisphaera TaxID=2649847 RepID=UPI003342743E